MPDINISFVKKQFDPVVVMQEAFDGTNDYHELFPGMYKFPDADALQTDIVDKIEWMMQRTSDKFENTSDMDIQVRVMPNLGSMTLATYAPYESTDEKALFGVSFWAFAKAFYGAKVRGRIVTNTRIAKSLDHEMRHHLDGALIRARMNPDATPFASFEDYFCEQIAGARMEGFAGYDGKKVKDLEHELIRNTRTVKHIFDYVGERVPCDNPSQATRDIDEQVMTLSTAKRASPDFTEFSSYEQGRMIMEVVAQAQGIDKKGYLGFLRKIAGMPLTDFYDLYFKSLDKLGFGEKHQIYPRQQTLDLALFC